MASQAALALETALSEVEELLSADPTPRGGVSPHPELSRVLSRAAVVLLAGHLERYVRDCNEELVEWVEASKVEGNRVPVALRLRHTQRAVEELARTQWDNRSTRLATFVQSDAWLWSQGATGTLEPSRLLEWMRSPKPKSLKAYFAMWGIPDIFTAITRRPNTRADLHLRLASLVDKRNLIAHGDHSVDATPGDIRAYSAAVRVFCARTDATIARHAARSVGANKPW